MGWRWKKHFTSREQLPQRLWSKREDTFRGKASSSVGLEKGEVGLRNNVARSHSKPSNRVWTLSWGRPGSLDAFIASGKALGSRDAGIPKEIDLSSVAQFRNLPLLFAFYLVPLTTSAFFKLLRPPHGKLQVTSLSQSSFTAGSRISTQTPLISTSAHLRAIYFQSSDPKS